jgi:hypothetical protein
MNKYQKLDILANYSDELTEQQIWDIVNSFSIQHVREIMPLLFACDLGQHFEQACGIADWLREKNSITAGQCRWVVLMTASRWHTMTATQRTEIQSSL